VADLPTEGILEGEVDVEPVYELYGGPEVNV